MSGKTNDLNVNITYIYIYIYIYIFINQQPGTNTAFPPRINRFSTARQPLVDGSSGSLNRFEHYLIRSRICRKVQGGLSSTVVGVGSDISFPGRSAPRRLALLLYIAPPRIAPPCSGSTRLAPTGPARPRRALPRRAHGISMLLIR